MTRTAKILVNDSLAGMLTETAEGEYFFTSLFLMA